MYSVTYIENYQSNINYPYKSSSVKISIDSLTASDISSNFLTFIFVGFEWGCRYIGDSVVSCNTLQVV